MAWKVLQIIASKKQPALLVVHRKYMYAGTGMGVEFFL
jgi:hypothetical protein